MELAQYANLCKPSGFKDGSNRITVLFNISRLSTVMLNKKITKENLFPNLVTKEDYVAWLNITKSNIKAHNVEKNLVIWRQVKNSLSSNFLQKFFDGFRVYYIYEKFNIIKSIFFLMRLSVYSLKRKI